jgi:predicted thioesterase
VTETIPVVNGTPATGPVIFSQNGTVIGTGTLNAQGVASFTTTTLPVGTDPITASYPGDSNYTAINSGPVNEVVNKANGADTLTVNPDPSIFGNTVTITDTVPTVGGVAPTGTVTFTNNGTTIGTAQLVNGVATLTTTTLPVGSDPISAAYGGDNNYAPVTTGPVNEIITTGNTTPVLGATPNPTTFGTPVTLTESIPGINGVTPTGTVQFFDNGTLIGTGTVNAQGVATLVTSTLPIGTDPITAKYSGDTNYSAGTTGPLNVVVNKAAPVDTLTSAPTPTTFGTPVTATFTVPLVNGVVPTGLVSFYNGTTLIGTGNVNASGVATITTSNLPVGTDTITAKYPGDNTYAPASPTTTEVVGLATGIGDVLTSSPNPSNFGTPVIITETLPTVGGVAPTGTVNFFYNGTQIGTGTVSNGVATFTTSTLPVGNDPITATYSGDGNYATVNSGPETQVVNNAAGIATLTVNPNPTTYGTPVTITETITPINGACPAGPATFLDNGTSIGTGVLTLIGGKCVATLTTSTLPVGTDSITATVPASNGFAPTNSGPVNITVGPQSPVTTVTTNVPTGTVPACGTSVTLTDTVTQINGTAVSGTVQFYDNGVAIGSPVTVSAGGVATFTTTALPCGVTNTITAIFTPSAGSPYGPSTGGPVTLPVAAPDFSIAATPANQIVNPGDSAVYTVSLSGVTVPFTSPVTLTATCNCQGVTISFANPTVTPGQGPTSTTMTVVTSPTFAMSRPTHGSNEIFYGLLLLPLLGLGKVRRKLRSLPKGISYCLAALVLLGGLGAVTGCGGGYYGPQPKTCTITITGTSGTLTHSTTVTVTVR